MDKLDLLAKKVKHGKLKLQKKKVKEQILKDSKPKDYEREDICKQARKEAHKPMADIKREISNDVRRHSPTIDESKLTLSEALGLDFIEEGLGYSDLDVYLFDKPQKTELTESLNTKTNKRKYKALGIAEGTFAPIGEMSRNNRRYDDDHWQCVLENVNLQNKIASRGMLGTLGHYNKKVDDEDLAKGLVSHIVTDLKVCEDAEGKPILYGRLEILNTPAGRLLKEYYEMGVPLYVSSRGGGKLIPVANEDWQRVDKTNYYLETFDVVKEPGFLQAKPNYVNESIEETKLAESKSEDGNMEETKTLQEKVEKLTKIVEDLVNSSVEETVSEEKVDERCDKKEVEEKAEKALEELNGDKKKEATNEAKEEKCDKCGEKECKCEKTEGKEEIKEEKTEETTVTEEKVEESVEKTEETTVTEEKETEPVTEENIVAPDQPKEEKDKTDKEEGGNGATIKEGCEEVADKKEDEKHDDTDKEEHEIPENATVDYKAECEATEKLVEKLLEIATKASDNFKTVSEQLDALTKEHADTLKDLNSYKLVEEFSITLDEAKEKLSSKSYDEIREEMKSALDEAKEAEIKETAEQIAESKEPIAESKHVRVYKIYQAFGD